MRTAGTPLSVPAADHASQDTRRIRLARLRRMQAMATGLLAAMAGLFLLTSYAERQWPWAAYVRAFAEAAMVGGCADWFAVTALFRRPFGLPIPHTAIIPRGKDRIGGALGRFIVENFLSPQVLDAKLQDLALVTWVGDWLKQPRNARALAARLVRLGPALVRALPQGALEGLVSALALAAARSIPAAPTASALLRAAWSGGRAEPLIDRAAEKLEDYLSEHQDVILENVQAQSWKWLPSWVDKAIAGQVTRGLVRLLADVRRPDHPWRAKLGEAMQTLIERLASDPDLRERGEALKRQLLDDPKVSGHISSLWAQVRDRLAASDWSAAPGYQDRLETLLCALGDWLRGDAAMQRSLNEGARTLVRDVLAPRREAIGHFVAQVVEGWDAASVVERLELQVGPDLQYIRVNGAMVGGLVGLALFALSRALGLA